MSNQKLIAGETALVPIERIKMHPDWPYRKELGFIDGLAKSMNGKNGQLQPIGIDTSAFLIWGRRRLEASKKLGWTEILCRIVDFSDPMTAMKEENENRLNPTPSEMTAIMRCIEASERAKGKARQKIGGKGKEIFPDPSETGQARDKAAEAFGLSGKTFEAMKTIEDQGTEKLKDAWNAGEISTHDAASAASEPPNVQNEAVKRVRKRKAKTAKQAVKDIKDEHEPEEIVDDDGYAVPARLREIFAWVERFRSLERSLRKIATELKAAEGSAAYRLAVQGMTDQLLLSTANLTGANRFHEIRPAVVHRDCGGEGCAGCRNGYLTAQERDNPK
jgi:ParB-like chromosome segregation protein Spo0J